MTEQESLLSVSDGQRTLTVDEARQLHAKLEASLSTSGSSGATGHQAITLRETASTKETSRNKE
jgi:hypothetical protein